ncbi:hypothetical protein Tco_0712559 [Tanacetum coccineum]
MPHDSPLLRVHTLRSDEGRMQYNELMDLVTKLSDRVVALETDLTKTKKVYGDAFTKLIKKVKRLEKKDKLSKSRRKLRLMGVSTASIDFTTANVLVTIAGAEISTASLEVKTADVSIDDIAVESLMYIRRSAAKTKDKCKDFKNSLMKKRGRGLSGHMKQLALSILKNGKTYKIELKMMKRSYTLHQLRGYSFDEIKSLFEATMKRVNTFTLMESDVDIIVPKIAAGSNKRAAEEELGQQSSKKQKSDKLSQKELQQLMIIVPEEGMNIEALQTKYPIID